jgi:hypothetical protein
MAYFLAFFQRERERERETNTSVRINDTLGKI